MLEEPAVYLYNSQPAARTIQKRSPNMKNTFRKLLPGICIVISVLFLAAALMQCGCSDKKKDPFFIPSAKAPERPDVGGTSYNCAAHVGDLLTYQFNTIDNLFSFAVLKGEFSGDIGCGSLTPLGGFGPEVYTTSTNDTVVLLPDKLALIGTNSAWLVAGVPEMAVSYNVSNIEGYYNFVEYTNVGGTPTVHWGTLRLDANTWQYWLHEDGATSGTQPELSGTWADQGTGVINISMFGGAIKVAFGMLYPSANGNIFVMDLKEDNGILLGVKQQNVTSGDFDGTYDSLDTEGTPLFTVTVAGGTITDLSGPSTLYYNDPWTGFVSDHNNITGVMSTDGVLFAVRHPLSGAQSAVAGIKE